MTFPRIILIAAVAANGTIGKGGQLPFAIPADMARFKQLTMGKTVLMGRKTYESLPNRFRPLPGRTNVVLTRQRGWQPHPDVQVMHDPADLPNVEELWVIGGGELYAHFLPLATRLELTEVHAEAEGDTAFPPLPENEWHETLREPHPASATTPAFDFVSYLRKKGSS